MAAGLKVAPSGLKLYARISVELSLAAGGLDSVDAPRVVCPCRLIAVLATKLTFTLPSALAILLALDRTPPESVSVPVLFKRLVLMVVPELPVFATVMDSAWLKVAEALSVTCTVKLKLPAVVGVPEMVPAVLSVRPPGRDPELVPTENVYVPTPPDAASACEYGEPTVPEGSEEVDIVSALPPLPGGGTVPVTVRGRLSVPPVRNEAVWLACTPLT